MPGEFTYEEGKQAIDDQIAKITKAVYDEVKSPSKNKIGPAEQLASFGQNQYQKMDTICSGSNEAQGELYDLAKIRKKI